MITKIINMKKLQLPFKFGFLLVMLAFLLPADSTFLWEKRVLAAGWGLLLMVWGWDHMMLKVRPSGRGKYPRYILTGYFLALHPLLSLLLENVLQICSLLLILRWNPELLPPNTIDDWIVWIAISIWYVIVVRLHVVFGIITWIKGLVNNEFNIVLFRRFAPNSAEVNRQVVAPIVGAYGQVVALEDETLLGARAGADPGTESVLGDIRKLHRANDSDWKSVVTKALSEASIVVFHWDTFPTSSMRWEFEKAVEVLPSDRLLLIISRVIANKLEYWLHEYESENNNIKIIQYDPTASYFHLYLRLPKQIYEFMKNLIKK